MCSFINCRKKYINCIIKIIGGKVIEFIGFGDIIFVLKKKLFIVIEIIYFICL